AGPPAAALRPADPAGRRRPRVELRAPDPAAEQRRRHARHVPLRHLPRAAVGPAGLIANRIAHGTASLRNRIAHGTASPRNWAASPLFPLLCRRISGRSIRGMKGDLSCPGTGEITSTDTGNTDAGNTGAGITAASAGSGATTGPQSRARS